MKNRLILQINENQNGSFDVFVIGTNEELQKDTIVFKSFIHPTREAAISSTLDWMIHNGKNIEQSLNDLG